MDDAKPMELHQLLGDWQWLRRLARGLTADEATAEDAVQDTFLAAVRQPPAKRPEGARAWLATVLRNNLRNRHRSQRLRTGPSGVAIEDSASKGPTPDLLVERIELQRQVGALILGLPPPLRDVIMLSYLEELTSEQVGARLGVPPGTVRWRLKTGLQRIREELDRTHDGDRSRWKRILLPLAAGELPLGATGPSAAGRPLGFWAGAAALVAVSGAFLVQRSCAGSDTPPGTASRPGASARPVALAGRPPIERPPAPTVARVAPGAATIDPDERAVVLRGTVLDTGGGPIVSAQVVALSSRILPGGVQKRSFSTRTNERGLFSLHLPVDHHAVRVTSPGYAGEERDLQLSSDFEQPFHLNPEARITGVVLDELSGQPVGGARVELAPGPGPNAPIDEVITDVAGRFELRGLDPGTHILAVSQGEQIGRSAPLQVRFASVLEGVVLTVRPGLSFAGALSDADGRPLAGAVLHLARGRDPLLGEEVGRTDSDGAFRIAGLPPGKYHLTMMAEGHPSLTRRFVLPADEGTPVSWSLPRGTEIEGRIVDRDGLPMSGARVTARPRTTGDEGVLMSARTFSGEDGRFRLLGALPGNTSLVAEHRGPGRSLAHDLIVPPEGIRGVLLKVGVGAFVQGQVRWDDGTPAHSAQVVAQGPRQSAQAFTTNDGTFRIGPLPPGHYRVNALWPNFPIKGVGPGLRPDRAEIQLEGDAERTVDLELPALRATVRGQIRDQEGHPVEGAQVQAMQRVPNSQFPRHPKAVTDAEGNFQVVSIRAGRYSLFVRHPDHEVLEHHGQTAGDTAVTLYLIRRPP
jgi:RNA polymerase sigma factor (sigma-70 family)